MVNRESLLNQKGMVTKMAPLKTGVIEVNPPLKELLNMLRAPS